MYCDLFLEHILLFNIPSEYFLSEGVDPMAVSTERYADKIHGILSCYDRIVIQGTLPGFCYADGMTAYLYANTIRIFDYPLFCRAAS